MANDDLKKELRTKTVDAALEWSKQITTITTASLVLSGTFIKMFVEANSMVWLNVLLVSWISWGISIVFGLLYLGAVTSLFSRAGDAGNVNNLDVYSRPGIWIALVQVLAFFVGLGTFVAFIFKNL